jgi:hypothetical protein
MGSSSLLAHVGETKSVSSATFRRITFRKPAILGSIEFHILPDRSVCSPKAHPRIGFKPFPAEKLPIESVEVALPWGWCFDAAVSSIPACWEIPTAIK